ncbi:hypothetical protein [Paenibacillus sp. MMO-177]|uniref:hypothetical protein n=1 Tax=Paenibacillus sp. MMO-177 TaxID=3081289 RepID=UPI00301A145C
MTVNQLGLSFDEQALYNDLLYEFALAVQNAATDILFAMRAGATEALDDDTAWFVKQEVFNRGMDGIVFYVGAQHWLAFLDNYGTGSLMDKSNPWLDEYIRSGYFNNLRSGDMVVVGRPAGTYQMPNFATGHGEITRTNKRGTLAGQNLEQKINPRTKKPYFVPEAPKHWLERAMRYANEYLTIHVDKVFQSFNFNNPKYLRGGIR